LTAAEPVAAPGAQVSTRPIEATAGVESNVAPSFDITAYAVKGSPLLSPNVLTPLLSRHTGTNVGLDEIVTAASDLQLEYRRQGYPTMSVAFARDQITNGIVTLNVFPTAVPQIVVSGVCYPMATNNLEVARPEAASNSSAASAAAANALAPAISLMTKPASPEAAAEARAALFQKMAELGVQEKDTRIHVISTNNGPRFTVKKYLVLGNSVLQPATVSMVLANIDGAFGTNVSFEGIRTVVEELQRAYREHGYVTVAVGLPQQKLTNALVKVQVTEGRLADIKVVGNRYFSSNSVMRSLPSLHTNQVLNGQVFQAELNRANANQDRQIYPVIGPGPDPGTSDLTLKVKDQLPLHGKVEFNNQSSPGTPALRLNASAVDDNLWQLDHSLGIQYGFSPGTYKRENPSGFYDAPSVANYSGFYRLPLGNPAPIEEMIASKPGSFGYDEATHKFNLPPPSGQSSLTFFASRATIDTGLTTSSPINLYSTNGNSLDLSTAHEDLTVNSDIGSRLSFPLQSSADFQSVFSSGLDYKSYKVSSAETNIFTLTTSEIDYNTTPPTTNLVVSKDYSPVPFTVNKLEYLPLSFHYDASLRDGLGTATFGLGISANVWYSSLTSRTSTSTSSNVSTTATTYLHGARSLQFITGSTESSGYWVTLNPSFSQEIVMHTNWILSFRADGQWASEPLISNEQFGIGGVNSVRGYHEGEAFGDTGWHFSLEQQTPPHVVGIAYGNTPLTIRGSAYMDCGAVYLLDPLGRPASTELWSTGVGLAASVGSHWEARFLFSLPLISTSITPRDQPFFNFALTAQF
jgi:hemolysin activation/secretion protein